MNTEKKTALELSASFNSICFLINSHAIDSREIPLIEGVLDELEGYANSDSREDFPYLVAVARLTLQGRKIFRDEWGVTRRTVDHYIREISRPAGGVLDAYLPRLREAVRRDIAEVRCCIKESRSFDGY